MSLRISLAIAWQYFKKRKGEKMVSIISLLSLIGVTIGVASLIIVMAIMNGFHIELTKSIIGLNSDIHILPYESRIEDYNSLKSSITSLPFVKKTIPMMNGQALASTSSNSVGAMIKGIDIEDLKYKETIIDGVIAGDFYNYHGDDKIALGSYLARQLKVKIGDKVRLISPNTISTIFGSMPRMKEFTIIAIFSSGMYEYDNINILMPIEAANKYFKLDGHYNYIECYTDDPDRAYEYSRTIKKELGSGYTIQNWLMTYASSLDAFKLERVAMFTILSLIICVASFNILSSLTMLVIDKSKDIAILKTIGASNFQILMIFVFNGLFIGIIGTLLGVLIGVSFTLNIQEIKSFLEYMTGITIFDAAIYFLENLPAKLVLSNVFAISGLSLLLSLLATIYPARKAAKMNPVDIIRYE